MRAISTSSNRNHYRSQHDDKKENSENENHNLTNLILFCRPIKHLSNFVCQYWCSCYCCCIFNESKFQSESRFYCSVLRQDAKKKKKLFFRISTLRFIYLFCCVLVRCTHDSLSICINLLLAFRNAMFLQYFIHRKLQYACARFSYLDVYACTHIYAINFFLFGREKFMIRINRFLDVVFVVSNFTHLCSKCNN